MTPWRFASVAFLVALIPCLIGVLRGRTLDRLVSLEMAALVVTFQLMAGAQMTGMPALYDLALANAALGFGGGLVFVWYFGGETR